MKKFYLGKMSSWMETLLSQTNVLKTDISKWIFSQIAQKLLVIEFQESEIQSDKKRKVSFLKKIKTSLFASDPDSLCFTTLVK